MSATDQLLPEKEPASLGALAWNFFVLGTTAFGGPPVHFGMYIQRFVEGRKWISQDRFAELMAMAGALPGPSSTQVAFAIGITQQGVLGGLVAGGMFLFPGAIMMTALGFASSALSEQIARPGSTANGVAIACSSVGVALVFIAVTGLVKKMVIDKTTKWTLAIICFGTAACCLLISPPPAYMNPLLIFLGGAITTVMPITDKGMEQKLPPGGKIGCSFAGGVIIFLLYLALAAWTVYDDAVDHGFIIPFLTAGMFVWGGGPVVLPMLMTSLTPMWIDQTIFITGIAIAEMMPGPVFNMSCFLGVQLALANNYPWLQGTFLAWACLVGPGVVLTFGAMPLWDRLRSFSFYNKALPGLNAAAVGLLVSTLFTVYGALEDRSPWKPGSRAVALCAYALIDLMKVEVPYVVLVAGVAGYAWASMQEGQEVAAAVTAAPVWQ